MGYRSDVRIVTSKKGFEELQKYVKGFLGDNNDYNLLKSTDVLFEGKNGVLMGWNNIKWYDDCDFKEIDAIENGMKHLSEKDFGYRFARIGENYDDYEEKSNDPENEEYLPFPSMTREFDDGYVQGELDYDVGEEIEKGVEV